MNFSDAHYLTGGLLVLLAAWQLARFAAGAELSRRAQALTLVTVLLLAVLVILPPGWPAA